MRRLPVHIEREIVARMQRLFEDMPHRAIVGPNHPAQEAPKPEPRQCSCAVVCLGAIKDCPAGKVT